MLHKKSTNNEYVISKIGMDSWFLYTVEECSFGKRITWTKNYDFALIFTSEEKVEAFKERVLEKVSVSINRFVSGGLVKMDA